LIRGQVFEISSRRLSELIYKLEQARLGSKEVLKVLKALDKADGPKEIESWYSRRRETANGMVFVLLASAAVLWVGIATMMALADRIPPGNYGLSAFISCVVLLVSCIPAMFYYSKKAESMDRKREQVTAILDSYRKSLCSNTIIC
jgi:hypothetical protein